MKLSDKGLKLILDGEVGGGKAYYDRFCKHPLVPDPEHTQSGVTIGIGWDCGQHSSSILMAEWSDYLVSDDLLALAKVCRLRGMAAKQALGTVHHIIIPWDDALNQFLTHTVQRFWGLTSNVFPEIEIAPTCVQEALLSVVFNRGSSMIGERRTEMAEIRNLIATRSWSEIPNRIRSMKRLWPHTESLRSRREAEAKHIEAAFEPQPKPVSQ